MKLTDFLETIQVQQHSTISESVHANLQSLNSLHNDLMSATNSNKKLNIIGKMILAIARG